MPTASARADGPALPTGRGRSAATPPLAGIAHAADHRAARTAAPTAAAALRDAGGENRSGEARPTLELRGGAPPEPVSEAPAPSGLPATIARAGLGAVSDSGDGSATVTFPTPGASGGTPPPTPFSAAPVTVSRSDLPAAPAPFSTAPVTVSRSDLPDAPAPATPLTPGLPALSLPAPATQPDEDEQFERMLERLKRELLLAQELRGTPFDEH